MRTEIKVDSLQVTIDEYLKLYPLHLERIKQLEPLTEDVNLRLIEPVFVDGKYDGLKYKDLREEEIIGESYFSREKLERITKYVQPLLL